MDFMATFAHVGLPFDLHACTGSPLGVHASEQATVDFTQCP